MHIFRPAMHPPALRRFAALMLLAQLFLACRPAASETAENERTEMIELLRAAPLIDGHNDVPWQLRERFRNQIGPFDFRDTSSLAPPMHTDLQRLERSGIGGVFWSVYTPTSTTGPGALLKVVEQIDVALRLVDRYPQHLELALNAADVERISSEGRIASLLGMEGGHGIESSLAALRQLYRLGVRYMTLTHSEHTAWADSATALARHNGLTDFGKEVVREMNRLGMLIDLSHVAPKTMHDALKVTTAPVIFSHSSVYELTRHARNVPGDVLDRLPENGGVVMVTFVPPFLSEANRQHSQKLEIEQTRLAATGIKGAEINRKLQQWLASNPEPAATLGEAADHIDALRTQIGIEHIGIGSDFDGITSVPVGLEDVSRLPELFLELRRRGYGDQELRAIAGGNVLRVLRQTEAAAQQLADLPASEARIETVDANGRRADQP